MEAGTFEVEVTEAVLGVTNEGKPQIGVACTFLDGPNAGQVLTAYLSFTEKTEGGSLRTLRLLGLRGDDLANDLDQILGARTKGLVTIEDDLEGNPRPRLRLGGGGVALKNVMNTDQKAAFAMAMKTKLAAMKPIAAVAKNGEAAKEEFFK